LSGFVVSPSSNEALVNMTRDVVPEEWEVYSTVDAKALNEFLIKQTEVFIGIAFNVDDDELPDVLNYTIRLPNKFGLSTIYPPYRLTKRITQTDDEGGNPYYYQSFFLTIQDKLERAFIALKTDSPLPEVQLKRFPYPSVLFDFFQLFVVEMMPFFMVISFIYSAKNIIKVWFSCDCIDFSVTDASSYVDRMSQLNVNHN